MFWKGLCLFILRRMGGILEENNGTDGEEMGFCLSFKMLSLAFLSFLSFVMYHEHFLRPLASHFLKS